MHFAIDKTLTVTQLCEDVVEMLNQSGKNELGQSVPITALTPERDFRGSARWEDASRLEALCLLNQPFWNYLQGDALEIVFNLVKQGIGVAIEFDTDNSPTETVGRRIAALRAYRPLQLS